MAGRPAAAGRATTQKRQGSSWKEGTPCGLCARGQSASDAHHGARQVNLTGGGVQGNYPWDDCIVFTCHC